MIEIVCLTICVGFSIDFVAPAVAYNESEPEQSRCAHANGAVGARHLDHVGRHHHVGLALFLPPTIHRTAEDGGIRLLRRGAFALLRGGVVLRAAPPVGPEGGADSIEHLPSFLVPGKRRETK